MMPFDAYPHRGRRPIGRLTGDNCRHDYGLKLQRLISMNKCAYCNLNLVDTYDHWLMMSVDHIVPIHTGEQLGITADWLEDYWNTVLCCSACKEFGDLLPLETDLVCPENGEEFIAIRDRIFAERKRDILLSHEHELTFFDSRPWRI